jgi:hypothetical protein
LEVDVQWDADLVVDDVASDGLAEDVCKACQTRRFRYSGTCELTEWTFGRLRAQNARIAVRKDDSRVSLRGVGLIGFMVLVQGRSLARLDDSVQRGRSHQRRGALVASASSFLEDSIPSKLLGAMVQVVGMDFQEAPPLELLLVLGRWVVPVGEGRVKSRDEQRSYQCQFHGEVLSCLGLVTAQERIQVMAHRQTQVQLGGGDKGIAIYGNKAEKPCRSVAIRIGPQALQPITLPLVCLFPSALSGPMLSFSFI